MKKMYFVITNENKTEYLINRTRNNLFTIKKSFSSNYTDKISFVLFQVVIVGNGGVGKSSMIQRYCKGTFTKDYKKTIGVDFLERQIE